MLHYPNGLTLTQDRRHLLVAEMLAGQLVSFPIEADGTLGHRTVWARLQDLAPPTPNADAYNGPDGLKLGPDGNYYIAQNGSGRLLVVDDDRKLVRIINVPTPYVTNMAFDPLEANVVFVTGAFEQWKPPFPGRCLSAGARWQAAAQSGAGRQLPLEPERQGLRGRALPGCGQSRWWKRCAAGDTCCVQLPCPELAFAGARRWWAVYEQYDTPAYRAHCRRLAQAIAPLIEGHLRDGDEVILIGLDGSPSSGVRFTSSKPDWGGRPNRPEDDWEIVPRRGIWIEELEAELARRGLPPVPATGWALDMGRFDEAGSRRDLEQFLDSRESAAGARGEDPAAP